MKTQKTRKFGKAVVAGLAAFMMLAEPFTASACPAEHHADAVECAVEEHCGVAVSYTHLTLPTNSA